MLVYIFGGEIYCEACGADIRQRLTAEGKAPENPDDEYSYDSDDFPKGPSDADKADCPNHCGSHENCLEALEINGEKYGKFLENELMEEGVAYVKEQHASRPTDITKMWMEHYDLSADEDEDDEMTKDEADRLSEQDLYRGGE